MEKIDYIQGYPSPLGKITMASDGTHLTGLWFDGQKYDRAGLSERYEEKILPIFEETKKWLDVYFSGKEPDFTPSIHLQATDFRKEVWKILLTIPYGTTITYRDIAAEITRQRGMPKMSAQAVGGAIGHNPISIIIPCHRVIGTNGSLTGYAGGIDKKRNLLALEKAGIYKI